MAKIATKNVVPLFRAQARLTELAEDVARSGEEKVFTRNGQRYVALISARQLDDYRRFKEAEQLSMLRALVEAAKDIEAGHVYTWEAFKPRLARLRAKAKRIART